MLLPYQVGLGIRWHITRLISDFPWLSGWRDNSWLCYAWKVSCLPSCLCRMHCDWLIFFLVGSCICTDIKAIIVIHGIGSSQCIITIDNKPIIWWRLSLWCIYLSHLYLPTLLEILILYEEVACATLLLVSCNQGSWLAILKMFDKVTSLLSFCWKT